MPPFLLPAFERSSDLLPARQRHISDSTSRPAHVKRFSFTRYAKNFPARAKPAAGIFQSQNGTDTFGVGGRPFQANGESRPAPHIVEELGAIGILTNNQIRTAILVVISHRGAPAFSVNVNPTFLARHRPQRAMPISIEEQSTPCIKASHLRRDTKEVLRQENVFIAVAIKI